MSVARISALSLRILTQFLRDKRTLGMLFFVPILVMSLLGYVFATEIKEIKIGVVNRDKPIGRDGLSAAEAMVSLLKRDSTFVVSEMTANEARESIEKGEIKAIVEFGKDFTQDLVQGRSEVVNVVLEGSDPQVNSTIARGIQIDLVKLRDKLKALSQRFGPLVFAGGGMSVEVETSYVYGGSGFETIDYFAPVYIAFFAFFFVFLLTSVSFLRERSRGTMERLLASPLSKLEIVIGYLTGFIVFAFAQSLIILLFAVYVLKINYIGSLLLVLLVMVILTVGAVNLGIFLSAFARNELQVVQFIPLVIIPQVLASGIVWPVEAMPKFLQVCAYAMPLTYANFALRDVMIKGFGIFDIGRDLTALVFFALLMMILGTFTLRREIA